MNLPLWRAEAWRWAAAMGAAAALAGAAEPAPKSGAPAKAPAAKTAKAASAPSVSPIVPNVAGVDFIDTSFENASPLWYEFATDGTVLINLLYDHERASPNRAAGHVHFAIQGKPGTKVTLELRNLDNVWNGVRGNVARELKAVSLSEDGRTWRAIETDNSAGDRVRFAVELTGPRLYVARVEPYRISDLERLLAKIRANPLVGIEPIGKTVQGRELEIVRVGREDAPRRVFLRARAHPWEPGGNWVIEGLVARLLRGDAEAQRLLARTCYYILPMANKDGVALGRTRFNLLGKDLNREWNKPVDGALAPENLALEKWLERMIAAGKKPDFAMELHNDGGGRLHISRPPVPGLPLYLERMALFEKLLRQHTWFTEGATNGAFRNSGTLGDGWLERYGVDAVVHEFNCHWIAGLQERPLGRHWQDYGAKLTTVFEEYFAALGK
jgi:hypothetical protein